MRRKVFDMLASAGGVIVVIVLAVAGGMLFVGYSFANNYVHTQLAEQHITFPAAAAFAHPKVGSEITPSMVPSVSQYAQLSSEAMALPKGSAAYTAAEAKAQTVFQGTTLRAMLLEAYGFSLIATIAFWCAMAAFALAAVMAVLAVLGFVHATRTDESEELMTHHLPKGVVISA